MAGAAYQGLFKNPLVSPDILGVASGAGFGAALAILLSWNLIMIQLSASLLGSLPLPTPTCSPFTADPYPESSTCPVSLLRACYTAHTRSPVRGGPYENSRPSRSGLMGSLSSPVLGIVMVSRFSVCCNNNPAPQPLADQSPRGGTTRPGRWAIARNAWRR